MADAGVLLCAVRHRFRVLCFRIEYRPAIYARHSEMNRTPPTPQRSPAHTSDPFEAYHVKPLCGISVCANIVDIGC